MVPSVGDEYVSLRVHANASRPVQRGGGGRTAVAAESGGPVARNRTDYPVRSDRLNAVVAGNKQISFRVYSNAANSVRSGRGRAAVAAESGYPVACDCADNAVWSDLSNAEVGHVGDEQIPLRIYGDVDWRTELSGSGKPIVSAKSPYPAARNRADHAVRRHFSDAVVGAVGDEQIPLGVYINGPREIQLSSSSRPVVSAKSRSA